MEKLADTMGQIIFRLETNFTTYRSGKAQISWSQIDANKERGDAILADVEKLKEMKDLLTGKRGEIVVSVPEEERQMVLMALAHLAVERPGWDDALNRIALKMDIAVSGKAKMFESFKDLRTDTLHLATQSPVKSSV